MLPASPGSTRLPVASSAGCSSGTEAKWPAPLRWCATKRVPRSSGTLTAWVSGRIAASIGNDLSDEAFYRTLLQPYIIHLGFNSSEVMIGISQVNGIISGVLAPCLQLFACAVILGGALFSMLVVSWQATVASVVLLGGSYVLIAVRLHRPLQRNGQILLRMAEQEMRVLQESLGGIRDMLIDNSQLMHRERYRSLTTTSRRLTADSGFLQSFPRFVVEALAYTLIGIGGYLMVARRGTIIDSLPLLGVFALAAQSILPNLQQIYSCWGSIRASSASLQRVMDLISQPIDLSLLPVSGALGRLPVFQWKQEIELKDLHFSYDSSLPATLNNISLNVYPNPATNSIYLISSDQNFINKDCSYTIYNELGQNVSQGALNSSKTIDIQDFNKGIYFLQLQNKTQIIRTKFLK